MPSHAYHDDALRTYLEVESKSVEGWLLPVARFIIPILNRTQREQGIRGDLCEIGVWHGLTLLMFDRLATADEGVHGYDIVLQDKLLSNLKKLGSGKISVHQADSTRMSPHDIGKNSPNGIRFFHVDGYHTAKVALNDLTLAAQTAQETGIILLDDFFSPTVPGVTEAFYQWIFDGKNNGFFPFALGGGKVYLSKQEYLGQYRDALFMSMPMPSKNGANVDVMFGNKVAVYDLW